MFNKLVNKCQESEAFSWAITISGIAAMVAIALI